MNNPQKLCNPGFNNAKYLPNPNTFKSFCGAINFVLFEPLDKHPFATLHATPGLGKSSLMDHIAYCVIQNQKKLKKKKFDKTAVGLLDGLKDKNWLRNAVVIWLSYSFLDIKLCDFYSYTNIFVESHAVLKKLWNPYKYIYLIET